MIRVYFLNGLARQQSQGKNDRCCLSSSLVVVLLEHPWIPVPTPRLLAGASDSWLAQSSPQASTNWTCWVLTSWKACAVRNRVHQSAQVLQTLMFLVSLQSEVGGTVQADRAAVRTAAANSRRAFEPDVSARMGLGSVVSRQERIDRLPFVLA